MLGFDTVGILSVDALPSTKIYFPSTGDAVVSPTFSAAWENQALFSPSRRPTSQFVTSTAMATLSAVIVDAPPNTDYLAYQGVSFPLAGNQRIMARALNLVIKAGDTNAAANCFMAWSAYVVSNDGTTVRGTLQAVNRDNLDITTTLTSRFATVNCTAVDALDTDRIVVELGIGGSIIDETINIRIGDANSTDLLFNDTQTTDLNPYLEFTQILMFGPEVGSFFTFDPFGTFGIFGI